MAHPDGMLWPGAWRYELEAKFAPALALSLGCWFPRSMGRVAATLALHHQLVFADGPSEWAQAATQLAIGIG